MKRISLFIIISLIITSCGQSSSPKEVKPLTFEDALKIGYGPKVSDIPDTLALGYYWGMSKAEANVHIKSLAEAKKVYYKNKRYMYTLPLTHFSDEGNSTEDYVFRVSTETYKDTIKALHLLMKSEDNNHNHNLSVPHDVVLNDVLIQFKPIFEEDGYLLKSIKVSQTGMDYIGYMDGIPEPKWIGFEYRFIKGNTLIRIWRGESWMDDIEISYYDLSRIYQEQNDIAEKKAIEAEKERKAEEIKEQKRQEALSDF